MSEGPLGTAAPLLSGRGLQESFGAVRVIHAVDFDVWPGEVLGILGPNGAGKTTLFNLISGDVALDAGELTFQGERLKGEPPFRRCRRGIGRTYQIPRPYGGMTAFENLLVAAMFGGGQSERASCARCAAILEECGLGPKANQLAGSLTLLDRKRLELARAVASGPRLLLLGMALFARTGLWGLWSKRFDAPWFPVRRRLVARTGAEPDPR